MIKVITSIVVIILASTLINYSYWKWDDLILRAGLFSIIIYLFVKEMIILLKFFGAYMFNLRTDFFNKKIERPRLFVYLTLGTASIVLFIQYSRLDKSLFFNQYITSTLVLVPLIFCVYILNFTWNKRFYEKFVEKVQKQILARGHKSYELSYSNRQRLELIYENLYDNNFIDVINIKNDDIDKELFSEILFSGKIPEYPVFKLNMDNIQTKYLFDIISVNSKNFSLDVFLKIFENKNKKTTRNSVEASFSKAKSEPKMKKEITNSFH